MYEKMYRYNCPDPGARTWVLFVQAYQSSRRVAESELVKQGISLGQFHILLLLASAKTALTPGQIASYLFKEKHTVSERLTVMEKAGYVMKGKNPQDDRLVEVRITPSGRKSLERVVPALHNAQRMTAAFCSDRDMRVIEKYLEHIRDTALQQLGVHLEKLPAAFHSILDEKGDSGNVSD